MMPFETAAWKQWTIIGIEGAIILHSRQLKIVHRLVISGFRAAQVALAMHVEPSIDNHMLWAYLCYCSSLEMIGES